MTKHLAFLLPLLLLLNSCFVHRWSENRKVDRALTQGQFIDPPGGVEVGPNFYADETENSNFSWLEYEYWTKRTFGESSPETNATKVEDTNWLLQQDTCLADFYLRHPAFRNYPVVNITPEQAARFAQWRSDRVFEYLLIRTGRLEWNINQQKDDFFSTERYFAGLYGNAAPDPSVRYYPEFHLVTLAEAKRIEAYNDSLVALKGNRFITKKRNAGDNENSSCRPEKSIVPLSDADTHCRLKKGRYICNFDANAAEWRTDPETGQYYRAVGDTFTGDDTASPGTGFRMVCTWKKVP